MPQKRGTPKASKYTSTKSKPQPAQSSVPLAAIIVGGILCTLAIALYLRFGTSPKKDASMIQFKNVEHYNYEKVREITGGKIEPRGFLQSIGKERDPVVVHEIPNILSSFPVNHFTPSWLAGYLDKGKDVNIRAQGNHHSIFTSPGEGINVHDNTPQSKDFSTTLNKLAKALQDPSQTSWDVETTIDGRVIRENFAFVMANLGLTDLPDEFRGHLWDIQRELFFFFTPPWVGKLEGYEMPATPNLADAPLSLVIASPGATHPWKYSPYYAYYVQVYGFGQIQLFSPDFEGDLYTYPSVTSLAGHSQALFEADAEQSGKWPRMKKLVDFAGLGCYLEPGDVVIIPPYWYHRVAFPKASVGVTVWSISEELYMTDWLAPLIREDKMPFFKSMQDLSSAFVGFKLLTDELILKSGVKTKPNALYKWLTATRYYNYQTNATVMHKDFVCPPVAKGFQLNAETKKAVVAHAGKVAAGIAGLTNQGIAKVVLMDVLEELVQWFVQTSLSQQAALEDQFLFIHKCLAV
eukprot:TRINITY_DN57446_c0_g1_i1.p1 TRINITY_DN57446_c0_g1~~TRINITY_DN57446_c0_g1_i1.p1  ORF type:complete len:541 (+),score=56.41 TRINITY_DN57446_c0_g1_i1:61-1623(+)